MEITATRPQNDFLSLSCKYPAFVAGFGTGKSEIMCISAIMDSMEGGSDSLVAMYEPTYDLVRLILAPRMEEKLTNLGVRYKYNKSENIIYTSSTGMGDFVLRTLDNPARIVGYESFRAKIDELDTLKTDHAKEAWIKIIARNRQNPVTYRDRTGKPMNTVSVFTTPEGFRFVYNRWVKEGGKDYKMIQASTMSNPFLPDDYVDSLRTSYPAQLIEAYLNGEFVNLTSGTVYYNYCKKMNNSTVEIDSSDKSILVGMDFNVTKMSARVLVRRGNDLHCVDELNGLYDTADMIEHLKLKYPDKRLIIYPDASGDNRKTSADETDIQMLKAAGFTVRNNPKNPRVRSRINAVNAALKNAKGETRLFVNQSACPQTVEDLLQQVYTDKGEPDKSTGNDHGNDALGYVIAYEMPINANKAVRLY